MTAGANDVARSKKSRFEPDLRSVEPPRHSHEARGVRVAQWIATLIVFMVAVELTCRIEDWVTYRTPITARYTSINDLVIRDADGMHGRANSRFQKWSMNSLGLRGTETGTSPVQGTLRVIAVGASETFGLRESPGREYPRQMEDSIAARAARGECDRDTTVRFEVLNAAFAGMGLPTIDQDVNRRLRRLHPDFIFIYPSPAQYLEDAVPLAAPADPLASTAPPPASRALRPRAVARIRDQLKLLIPSWAQTKIRALQTRKEIASHPPGWRFTAVPDDRLVRFESDLRHLIGTVRSIGAEPVVATHANRFMGATKPDPLGLTDWEKFYPRATGQTIVAFDSLAALSTLRVATDSNVVAVDAAHRLETAGAPAFADFVHFTDLGASHMADIASRGVIAAVARAGRCHARRETLIVPSSSSPSGADR